MIDSYIQQVRDIWHRVINIYVDDIDMPFFDAGGSSISLAYIRKEVKNIYDLDLSLLELYEYKTIGELSEFIHAELLKRKYKKLLNTYKPDVNSNLGKSTRHFFESLNPEKDNFNLENFRESSKIFDGDIILPYPKTLSHSSYQSIKIGPLNCKVLFSNDSSNAKNIIMFYGGGFCINMMKAHMSFMANVFKDSKCNIIIPEYNLAPEEKAEVILSNISLFLTEIIKNRNLFDLGDDFYLSGWSSGANLAITSAINLQKNNSYYAHVKSLILFSSWIDLTMNVNKFSPYQDQQSKDIFAADHKILYKMANLYANQDVYLSEYDITNREMSELKKLPSTFIIVGEFDVLLSDSIYLTDALKNAGVETSLCILKGQTHNYPVFRQIQDGFPAEKLFSKIINNKYKCSNQYDLL